MCFTTKSLPLGKWSIFKKLCKIWWFISSSVQSTTAFLGSNPAIMKWGGKKEDFPVSHSTKLTVPWATFHCLATVTSDITCLRINKSKTRLSYFDSLDFTSEHLNKDWNRAVVKLMFHTIIITRFSKITGLVTDHLTPL